MTYLNPIERVSGLEDNNLCADCNAGSPTYYNLKYGVLICVDCGSIHEDLLREEVVWPLECLSSPNEVNTMLEFGGNKEVNNRLEKFLPSSYKKRFAQLHPFIKEQYIKKKYINKGFELEENGAGMNEARKVGILSKKSAEADSEWKLQYVILDRERNVLECFKKGGSFEPEESIPLDSAEVFIEKVEGHEGWKQCIKVSWGRHNRFGKKKSAAELLKEDSRSVMRGSVIKSKGRDIKHIFLATGWDGELFEWYSSILTIQGAIPRSKETVHIPIPHPVRLAKCRSTPALNIIDSKFPLLPTTVGISAEPIFLKTGKLWKTGPDKLDSWRERWFTLHNNHVIYSRSKLSTQASGEFIIGATQEGYRVEKGYTKHSRTPPSEYAFTITTPGRVFTLCTETSQAREEWIEKINKVIQHNNSTIMLKARDFNPETLRVGEGLIRKANSASNVTA